MADCRINPIFWLLRKSAKLSLLNLDDLRNKADALKLVSFLVIPRFTYPILVEEDPEDDIFLIAAIEALPKEFLR
jgi:hypothetical protein